MQPNLKIASGNTEPKENVDIWFKHGKNIFDEKYTQGQINDTTGKDDYESKNCIRTNYIEVIESTDYVISLTTKKSAIFFKIYQYDANKNFLKAEDGGVSTANMRKETAIKTEATTKYLRFKIGASGGFTPNDIEETMIEQNTIATEYEKHVDDEILIRNNKAFIPFRIAKTD